MRECDYCNLDIPEHRYTTHLLVNHTDQIEPEEGDIPVSKGYLKEKEVKETDDTYTEMEQ